MTSLADHNFIEPPRPDVQLAATVLLKWATGEETGLHLSYLIAGKNSLFSCSEDPQIEDARKCFIASLKEIHK